VAKSKWWQDPAAQDVLHRVLQEINRDRAASPEDPARSKHGDVVRHLLSQTDVDWAQLPGVSESEVFESLLDRPETRLAVYGSLAPGEKNHWVVQELRGSWEAGFVKGRLANVGWGGEMGFPGMTWDPDGDPIQVKLFDSSDLSDHWDRLDEFEGQDYCRILVPVHGLAGGVTVANIYEVRPPFPPCRPQ
jgi:gamma-glutamylcyclotransferase (GGCT)/AIG2-like uncharacterized protein YtfP